MQGKTWGWVLFALGMVGVAAGVCLFVWLGLSKGDQLASIVSVFVGVLGLGVSIAGLATTRRGGGSRPAQSITGSTVGGNAEVIRNVGGKVQSRGPVAPATLPTPPPTSSAAHPVSGGAEAELSIRNAHIQGSVRNIDNVTGDVDTSR